MLILFVLATSAIAEGIKGDANGDGRVSVTDITAVASYILGDTPANFDIHMADAYGDDRISVTDISALVTLIMGGEVESAKKDTIYIKYSGNDVVVVGEVNENVHIIQEQADVKVVIEKNPNIVINLSGKSDNGRFAINADTLVTLQLAGIDLTSSHAPAINSYGKHKIHVELVDGTNNCLKDGKSYSFNDSMETANGCLSAQGALTFSGKGALIVRGKSKHAIYSKKSIVFNGGSFEVPEASSDAIHSGKSVTIESGNFKLNGMKSEAIELDNDFTMEGGTIEMNITGESAKGIKCGGTMIINDGIIIATASGALKNKDGNLSYCTILKCDSSMTVKGGKLDLVNNSAGGKCISVDKNCTITGGIMRLETNADGAEYINANSETDYYTSKCIAADDSIVIQCGTINCLSTGVGGKGIVAGNYMEIGVNTDTVYNQSLIINVETTNVSIVNDEEKDERYGCPKAIKSGNILNIYSGNIFATTFGIGGEGIECGKEMYVYGGNIECNTYDDGINVGGKIDVINGFVYCNSINNDGVDSNGKITILGGVVIALNQGQNNESFDAENYSLDIFGGTVFGIGRQRVHLQDCSSPCYNTINTYSTDGYATSSIAIERGKYVYILKGNSVIMALQSTFDTDNAYITITNDKLIANEEYKICQGDMPSSPGESFFDDKFITGGTPVNSTEILKFIAK